MVLSGNECSNALYNTNHRELHVSTLMGFWQHGIVSLVEAEDRLLLKFISGRRRCCKQLCGEMEILCCVTFSCSRKVTINRLKDLLTKASIKVSIH